MVDSFAIDTALYDVLSGDATLSALVGGVHRIEAPEGAAFPRCVFQLVLAPDSYRYGGRVETRFNYQVKVIAAGSDQEDAKAALARVDELLTDVALDVEGWQLTRRQDVFEYIERAEGQVYQHVGANYLIVVTA